MGEPTSAEPLDHTVLKKPSGSREFFHNNKDNIVGLKVASDIGQIKFNEALCCAWGIWSCVGDCIARIACRNIRPGAVSTWFAQ